MRPSLDLTNCDQEPIQWPGFIQASGFLVVLDPVNLTIWQASENIIQLTGQPVEVIIGKSVTQISAGDLTGVALHQMLTVAIQSGRCETVNPFPFRRQNQDWFILLHQQDGALIMEFEPASQLPDQLPLTSLLSQTMSDIQRSSTLTQLLEKVVQKVKKITGFDRVMIYRFGEDWHGEVVAEAREPWLDPFLGLHYPASDIPRQARELYKINLIRGIGDVSQERVPIYPVNYAHYNRPLDLTQANLRAVSPMHVAYLKNMGVQSSLSISLLYRNELWGLIACHHYRGPRFIDFPARQSLKVVSQLLSTVLEIRKDDEEAQFSEKLQQAGQVLNQQMQSDWDIVQGLTKHPQTALELNSATGAALLFDEQLHQLGDTPSSDEIFALIDWIKNSTTERIFQTDQLPNLYPPAELYRQKASGVLLVVLSRQMNEYLLWFKPELIQEVSWGGNPDKPVEITSEGNTQLSPRKSFEKWTQLVHNKAHPWQQMEVAMALKLREDILQVVDQKANQLRVLNEKLRLSNEQLEAFSYTVSHELRSPLSSIRRYAEIYREDYGARMDEPAKAIFTKIEKASERMSILIRNIMHYSQIGSSGFLAKTLPMRELLGQLREELLSSETGRDLTIHIGPMPDLTGDQTMVTQVFSNLLNNAVKYTRSVPSSYISVQGVQTENELIYSVTDNGIGIDMKQAGKVFELFQRLDSAASYEGYGVGLAIVKRILSRHKGKVWFESVLNQSTTFYVSFPSQIL
ncbi:ATP-binding protein [Spirosoma pollinicola]|uniref:histidine kinase n=1 Tax=Spirosoma pollinicola TaxID=2057025 RepID=A0A2K8YS31_9BACT|nr:ATP-binding protein [Spirosoma pollinicola]AUD00423.1 histidine kinase [Spirosoma pollinicola]